MDNQYDVGIKEDFDFMTEELGRECVVYSRNFVLTSESQESDEEGAALDAGVPEVVFLQELDTKHEMIASGQLAVGDVRFTFKSDSIAEEEGIVTPDNGITKYKIQTLTRVGGMTNNIITNVKAFGKKLPNR